MQWAAVGLAVTSTIMSITTPSPPPLWCVQSGVCSCSDAGACHPLEAWRAPGTAVTPDISSSSCRSSSPTTTPTENNHSHDLSTLTLPVLHQPRPPTPPTLHLLRTPPHTPSQYISSARHTDRGGATPTPRPNLEVAQRPVTQALAVASTPAESSADKLAETSPATPSMVTTKCQSCRSHASCEVPHRQFSSLRTTNAGGHMRS